MVFGSHLSVDDMREALKKIDSLGISVGIFTRYTFDLDDYSESDFGIHQYLECNYSAEKLRKLFSKTNRVLHVYFDPDPESDPVNLQPVLEACESLQNLYISLHRTEVHWEKSLKKQQQQQEEMPWTKHLESVILNFDTHHHHGDVHRSGMKLKQDDVGRNERIHAHLQSNFYPLLQILKRKTTGLKFLRLSCCENNFYYNEEESFTIHTIESFLDELKAVQTLEHVDLTFNHRLERKLLAGLFDSLKGLRKLEMTLCPTRLYAWDEDFPFESLAGLSELDIVIRTNRKNYYEPYQDNNLDCVNYNDLRDSNDYDYNWYCDIYYFDYEKNKDKTKTEWGADFVEGIPKLTSLQTLRIVDMNDRRMNAELFCDILKACSQLKKLRKLIMEVNVLNDKMFFEVMRRQVALAFDEGFPGFKKNRDVSEQEIQDRVSSLIIANPDLSVIDIRKLKIENIERIFYTK